MNSVTASRRRLLAAAFAGLMTALIAGGAVAQTDQRFGPLDLGTGFLDPWQLTMTADGYFMENTANGASIRFNWAGAPSRALGSRTITTQVEIVESHESSNAGLLYGYEENEDGSSFYYMFMLRPDSTVTLYRRDPDGVIIISSARTDAVVSGLNELSVREDGDQATFLVNGEVVAIVGGTRAMGAGGSGIVTWGRGTFRFASYSAAFPGDEPATAPAPDTPSTPETRPPAAK